MTHVFLCVPFSKFHALGTDNNTKLVSKRQIRASLLADSLQHNDTSRQTSWDFDAGFGRFASVKMCGL